MDNPQKNYTKMAESLIQNQKFEEAIDCWYEHRQNECSLFNNAAYGPLCMLILRDKATIVSLSTMVLQEQ